MNKAELITRIADDTADTKATVERVLNSLAASATTALKAGEEFTIPGIGKLKVSERAARTARNPKTGETVNVPASKKLKLVTAAALKEAIQ